MDLRINMLSNDSDMATQRTLAHFSFTVRAVGKLARIASRWWGSLEKVVAGRGGSAHPPTNSGEAPISPPPPPVSSDGTQPISTPIPAARYIRTEADPRWMRGRDVPYASPILLVWKWVSLWGGNVSADSSSPPGLGRTHGNLVDEAEGEGDSRQIFSQRDHRPEIGVFVAQVCAHPRPPKSRGGKWGGGNRRWFEIEYKCS
ncbi:hypothetical protein K493DRAFT_355844 [Basidiobolus meristosporus CBS 931.73]|uniref:Uncharacterized protein n=1 Tax=Basidiobolus meristosporus CBS 931.73 TaxID=1314790 RepID=A0A1Y1Y0T7_9FUNG|nr:hypothetical protein K493DRAFT_355844 [Basidiobolus meristosporus CBS 931.73]|eukprot:ORX91244.1 hypothetical protein K493DRAFT_355844 [Basidiobolus meristosporus CBS 931.73]